MIKNQMLGSVSLDPDLLLLQFFEYFTNLTVSNNVTGGFAVGNRHGVRNLGTFSASVALVVAFLALASPAQTISTVAGGGPPSGLTATSVPIGLPWGVVQDGSGNTYIADKLSNRIFEVSSKNVLTIVAGNTVNNFFGDGGLATSASLSNPQGVALDGHGGLYIADTGNNVIRVVNVGATALTFFNGTVAKITIAPLNIATVVGSGGPCTTAPCGDGGFATSAELNAPASVFVDGLGNIFIADTSDSVIREVSPATGIIQTVAGTLSTTSSTCSVKPCGDGGVATSAMLNNPSGLFVDAGGDIFIADTGDAAIRVVNKSTASSFFGVAISNGNIGTVAGTLLSTCPTQPAPCGDNAAATVALLNSPSGVFLDGSGDLWIADTGDSVVRSVSHLTNDISLAAGDYTSCNAAPCSTELSSPTGVFVSGSNLLIADQRDDAIREMPTAGGNITTVAGVIFNESYFGDGGLAVPTAEVQKPGGVSADSKGNVYIADTGNSVIRKVSPQGDISTVVGNGVPCLLSPLPTCGDGGKATSAQLFGPGDVFVNSSGNIYIADSNDNVIRVANMGTAAITVAGVAIPAGDIFTVAGDGKKFDSGYKDGAVPTSLLNDPFGLFVDKTGNIYIADTGNNVIRVVNTGTSNITVAGVLIAAGDIATIAGTGTAGFSGDGGAATKAELNNPAAVFVDISGNIYISDSGIPGVPGNNRVRMVSISGTITTVAGDGTNCSAAPCGDGGPATKAQISNVWGIFVDEVGDLFISDSFDSLIREVTAANGNITTVAGDGLFGFSGDGGKAISASLAKPAGLWGDSSGDLLIADFLAWRVRKVAGIVTTVFPTTTALTISPSPANVGASVTFTATVAHAAGTAVPTGTVDFNNGTTKLGSGTLGTTGKATFTSSSLAAGSYSVTAVYSGNVNYGISTSSAVALSVESFTLAATAASPASVTAGASATATITLKTSNGFNTAVPLTCSVSPAASLAPTCALSPASVTPTSAGATSTLTINTTAATTGSLTSPAIMHRSNPFYAMWLLLPAMLLSTAGMAAPKRRKLLSLLFLVLAVGGCLFWVACGGGSSTSGGGGGSPGTPANTYTVTVTATPTSGPAQTQTVTLTVQ
jgi:hypothetical protein